MTMWSSTGDPVTDAERYQQYLDEKYPVKDGIVEYSLTVCFRVEGRGEDEFKEEAQKVLKRIMSDPSVWEWDVEEEKAEEY